MATHGPRVAVVGATGTVGSQITTLLSERGFPHRGLTLFGSDDASESESGESDGPRLSVVRLSAPADLADFDIVFLAVPEHTASEIIEAHPGPVLIDLSAARRLAMYKAPYVAPGLTPRERLPELRKFRLFAIPHPAAQVIATVLSALKIKGGFAAATVITSASAEGNTGISELFHQSVDLLNARLDVPDDQTQTAFNVFISPDAQQSGATIAAQAGALLGAIPALAVEVVRAPAFHGGAVAMALSLGITGTEAASHLRSSPGVILVESEEASGLVDAVGQEAIIMRLSVSRAGAASIWCTFDAARLAALSAVWIAEALSTADA